jgi:mRNA-degrading endonuclease YafQ of YafQ-DinJ toxin-antitoxin module
MQTFLPYSDFQKSAECLDKKRAWKQVVEGRQIVNVLTEIEAGNYPGYRNHPMVKAWKGYKNYLITYYNCFLEHCIKFHNIKAIICQPIKIEGELIPPPWIGYEPLHSSHRSRLLDKKFDFYNQYRWIEQPSKICMYPVDSNGQLIKEIQDWQMNK